MLILNHHNHQYPSVPRRSLRQAGPQAKRGSPRVQCAVSSLIKQQLVAEQVEPSLPSLLSDLVVTCCPLDSIKENCIKHCFSLKYAFDQGAYIHLPTLQIVNITMGYQCTRKYASLYLHDHASDIPHLSRVGR